MNNPKPKATIMDDVAMRRAVTRIAHEILEHNEGADSVDLVGIVSRGVPLADILSREIAEIEGIRNDEIVIRTIYQRDEAGGLEKTGELLHRRKLVS